MTLCLSVFMEVTEVLSQEASRGFTLVRMKNVYITVNLCFSLSESDNAQESRTDFYVTCVQVTSFVED